MDPRSDDPLAAQSGFERFLLDQVEAAVVAADPAGRITFWNRFAEELLGYMAEEALGRDVIELIVDRDDREAVLGILQCLGAGERWQGELDVVTKDGRTLPVRMRASPAHDAAGGFEGMASVLVDISEIRRGERRRSAQHAVTRVLADSESLAEAAPGILEAVGAGLGWEMGALWVIDPHAGRLQCVDTWTAPDAKLDEFVGLTRRTAFGRGTGLPGRVWSTGEPTWVPDVVVDENFPRAPSAAQHELHGAVAFPIVLGREVLGVLEFFSREIREPDQDLLATMTSIGSQLGQFLERRVAEEEARRSAARKSAMLESALDCIVSIDAAQRVVDFNPAAERTFGYTREEAVGRDVAELIVPERYHTLHRAGLSRLVHGDASRLLDRRVQLVGMRAGGEEFPAELAVARVSHEPPAFAGFIRDLSEQRRAEAAELDSRLRLEALLDGGRTAIYVKRGDGRYMLVNREYAAIFGSTAEEMLGQPPDARTFGPHERQVLETGEAREDEEVVVRDGNERVFLCSKFPLRDAQGDAYAVCSVATDITAQKAAEREARIRAAQQTEVARLGTLATGDQASGT